MAKKKPKNPFYVLLMVVGTMFALTALPYSFMTVRMSQPHEVSQGDLFFDTYGMWIMGAELTLLAVLTFAAIGTDDYWTRKAEGDAKRSPPRDDAKPTV